MKKKLRSITSTINALSAIVLVLIIWQAICMSGLVPGYMLPSPFQVMQAFLSEFPLLMENAKVMIVDDEDRLRSLGVPEEECTLPPIEKKIQRSEHGGIIFQRDPYGGVKVEDTHTGQVTCHRWNGISE